MSDRRGGRHAFDAANVTDVQETPYLQEGRREQRNGVLVLGVSAPALIAGLLFSILHVIPAQSGWHPMTSAAIIAGGIFTVQGIRMMREGRATVRDELRRQAEESWIGRAVDDE